MEVFLCVGDSAHNITKCPLKILLSLPNYIKKKITSVKWIWVGGACVLNVIFILISLFVFFFFEEGRKWLEGVQVKALILH